jgi:hypothetical protein
MLTDLNHIPREEENQEKRKWKCMVKIRQCPSGQKRFLFFCIAFQKK